MNKINLTKMMPEHLPEVLSIYNHAIEHTTATFDLDNQTLEDRTHWYNSISNKFPLYVALLDQQVIGYGYLAPFRSKEAYKQTVELSVYIHPDHQGKGAASLLIDQLIAVAPHYNFKTIISVITSGNQASIRLHEKFNFTNQGRLEKVGYKFDQWLDVDFYQLFI